MAKNLKDNEQQELFKDDFNENDKVKGQEFEFWKFKENPEIIGIFQEWTKDNYGEHAIIETINGIVHLPNLTTLNSKINSIGANKNDKIKAVYLGNKKSDKTGRHYEDFEVFVKSQ